jgi:hypothetical protein
VKHWRCSRNGRESWAGSEDATPGDGDGCHTVGEPRPYDGDWRGLKARLSAGNRVRVETPTGAMLFGPCEVLYHLSRGITSLPGDAVLLGAIGDEAPVRIPPGRTAIAAEIGGLGEVTATLVR